MRKQGGHRQRAMCGAVRAGIIVPAISLAMALTACGGGGGSTNSSTPATDSGSAGGSSGGSSGSSGGTTPGSSSSSNLAALQAQLDACPVGSQFNAVMGCLQGLYVGVATDNGSQCVLRYDERGTVWYSTDRANNRVILAALGASGATYYKAASASSASGFQIAATVGIASGHDMSLHWQDPDQPGSAAGLLVKSRSADAPDCLITSPAQVAASSSTATANQTGRAWDAAVALNTVGSGGLRLDSGATGNTGFEAGLADDGSAWITFAQADANGRLAVQVVRGRAGASGQAASWSAPVVLDDAAPLVAGYRPRLAVSATGHAVVAWITEAACRAQDYESSPAGKTCHYMMASRRMAGDTAWEAPQLVGASPPRAVHDHHVRINAAGDAVITYVGMFYPGFNATSTVLGLRAAGDSAWRYSRLFNMRSTYDNGDSLGASIHTALDDTGGLVVAGQVQLLGSVGVNGITSPMADAPETWQFNTNDASGTWFDELAISPGFAAYTSQEDNGPRRLLRPERISFWSAAQQRWLATEPSTDFAIWGDTRLVGTDTAGGEFLLYAGCRRARWAAGAWVDELTTLPAHCGLERSGGLYAFNRAGDYVGLHWGGHVGQWGYYRRSDNSLLKGAPGTAAATSADYLLGRVTPLFAPADSQLLLNRNGVALAVTASTYTAMPTASQAGTDGGGALRLWAMFLR